MRLLSLAALAALIAPPAAASPIQPITSAVESASSTIAPCEAGTFIQQNVSDGNNGVGFPNSNDKLGQSFMVPCDGVVNAIGLTVELLTQAGSATLVLYDGTGDGGAVLGSAPIAYSAPGPVQATFSEAPPVVAGQVYTFALTNGSGGATWEETGTNPYPGGTEYNVSFGTGGPGVFSPDLSFDLTFNVSLGESVDPGACTDLAQSTLNSQADVDGFNCTSVDQLDIQGADITNLLSLSELENVAGNVSITLNPQLGSLAGLENLTSVGGNLFILRTPLQSLSGLSGLQSVGGQFQINRVAALQNLAGLSSLSVVEGGIDILSNPSLTSLDGLEGVQSAQSLVIESNPQLTNVDALSGLELLGEDRFGRGLSVITNELLSRCASGLGPILAADQTDPMTIKGSVGFRGNASTGDCNSVATILAAYESGGGSSAVVDASLTNGTCPSPLPAGRASCRVQAGATLDADNGQRYTVFLRVQETNRVAFRGEIKPRPDTPVSQSVKFTTKGSDPTSFMLELVVEEGSVAAPGAGAEVIAMMPMTKTTGSLRANAALTAYPNPVVGTATLSFAVVEAADASLVVYDALGREVARLVDGPVEGFVEARLATSALSAGVYVARLTIDERVENVRLTVVR